MFHFRSSILFVIALIVAADNQEKIVIIFGIIITS